MIIVKNVTNLVKLDLHGVDEHPAASVGYLAADAGGVGGDVEDGHDVSRDDHRLRLACRMVRNGRLLQLNYNGIFMNSEVTFHPKEMIRYSDAESSSFYVLRNLYEYIIVSLQTVFWVLALQV